MNTSSHIKADIITDHLTQWIESPELMKVVTDYVNEHFNDPPDRLYLNIAKDPQRELLTHAVDQITARRKLAKKLSSFIACPDFIFPSLLAGEQATNEAVARYHTNLFGNKKRILDMTAGLGIDSLTAARTNSVTACELDPLKAAALRHNAKILSIPSDKQPGIQILNTDSTEYIYGTDTRFDIIFADPARRSDKNDRVYNPADCLPDMVAANDEIITRTDRLIIKHSPMLDIRMATELFGHLKSIHLICYKGELKEVLTDQQAGYDGETDVYCIDITDDTGTNTTFRYKHDKNTELKNIRYATIHDLKEDNYLCIPNAAVMKAAPWHELVSQYPTIKKLDPNTHIFISDSAPASFPGRVCRITGLPDRHRLKEIKGLRYNVVCRNYVMEAPSLEKKLKVKPGGDRYIIGVKCDNKPIIMECKIVN
ncbi:MAG: hypothetical protein K2H86_01445 [Muribaculaceae bacterium]|nr:hypothetical protein [Muribaculaceae bacterium]